MRLSSWNWFGALTLTVILSSAGSQNVAGQNETAVSRPTEESILPEIIGVVLELCEDERNEFNDVRTLLRNTKVIHFLWKIECRGYITFSNIINSITESGITRLVVVARRETLRFAESSLRKTTVKEWTAIPLNNELMVTGLTQSQAQRKVCKDRAGGKQFWGLMMSLLPDIIDKWQWRNLYLFVDEMFGLSEAKQVYTAFMDYQKIASLKVIMTTVTSNPMEFLSRLSYWDRGVREVKSVVVVCGRPMTKVIVEEASRRKLFSTYFRWLIFENGTTDILRNYKMQFDTDVIIMRHLNRDTVRSSFVTALERVRPVAPTPTPTAPSRVTTKRPRGQNSASAFNNKSVGVGISECYSSSISELALDKTDNRSRAPGKEYLPSDLHLQFLRVKKRTGMAMPTLQPIGEWKVATGLINMEERSYDFDGFTLQVVALHCPPYVIVHRTIDGRHFFKGYLVDILEALSIIMNFKYNITVPFDHTYGRCEGQLCSGIIGMLVRKEADLALANLTPTGSRVKVMDFATVAVDNAGLGMLLRRPSKSDTNAIRAYIMPFSPAVSICVAVAIPLCGIMLHLSLKAGAFSRLGTMADECHEDEPRSSKDNRSLGRCLFASVQSFAQQGIDIVPYSVSGRAMFGVMWLFSLFIMSSYTANLISYFTSTIVTWPFKSLDEVYDSRYYQMGFIKGTTYLDDIQGDNSTVLTKIWNRMEKQRFITLVDDLEEGMEKVRSESYILIHEARVLEYIAARDCEFAMISENYLSAPMTLAFQKESHLQKPISQMLLKISESGLLERLKNRWWPPTFDCTIAAQTFSSISLWGVLSVYGILLGGFVAGLVLMGLENGIAAQKIKNKLKAIKELTNIPEVVPNLHGSFVDKINQKFRLKKSSEIESTTEINDDQPSTS